MTVPVVVERQIRFSAPRKLRPRKSALKEDAVPGKGRTPRVTRLMRLALRFDDLLQRGEVESMADLARAGHVTRARMSQVMNFLHLCPEIQRALLELPPVYRGRDPISERDLRPIMAEMDWSRQWEMWDALRQT